jgi:hypothetical protein
MLKGVSVLKELQRVSGETSDTYSYQSGKIKSSSLVNGLKYYGYAIDKFFGNSLITRLMNSDCKTLAELREAFVPKSAYGDGDWVDIAGMIAPKKAVSDLLDAVERGDVSDVDSLNKCFADMHSEYYSYEWRWACKAMEEYYGFSLAEASVDELSELVQRWRNSVVSLDKLIYEDARKEFSLSAMTSFGADGNAFERDQDFMNVRGSFFEADPFVTSVKDHIKVKSALGDAALAKLASMK